MTGLFDQIKLLFEQQLYSNVVALANLVLTVSDHDAESLPPPAKFQTFVFYGDSLFYLGQYRKAEGIYRRALQFKKTLMKSKAKPQDSSHKELMPDIDIKYQIHLCHVHLKQNHQAMMVLQSIPGRQRTAKINMALGKLYRLGGMERSAVSCYKEVLRECPLALEAAEGLLRLGVKGVEVNSLMLEGAPSIANMEWLTSWIKAHAHIHSREYTQAVTTLRQLEERSPLRENHSLLVAMGECYYYSGDTKNALISLQRAQAQDPHMERGLDILAALLAKERRHKDLERLVAVPSGVSATEHSPEHWVAMAYLLHAAKRNSKAIYFAQKACMAHPRNVEALILKGAILMEIKKYTEAVIHFREAMQMAPHRFEPHLGLVDCYVGMHRLREALTIASNACKQLGQSPRALTLYASVLTKDPVTVVKARAVLEKALQQDERYLPAVYLLAEVLEQEMSVEAAISLLERQVAIQPTCLLHQMLGDLLARAHDEERALDHYSIALNLDPSNRRALEGLHRLDSSGGGAAGGSGGSAGGGASGTGGAGGSSGSGTGSGTGKLDGSYYMGEEEGAGGPAGSAYERLAAAAAAAAAAADAAHARVTAASAGDSENEATTGDADESETEAVWSDMDLELASHFI
ncbi:hypothetical protein R5R35_014328 [Gryllus longicercus]|uniref:Anaphase-promoting complex subunit 7 n=1 Tax=Gryllus longicercus TaxID=2509291 RepID=A0AAN9VM49_9ORTH